MRFFKRVALFLLAVIAALIFLFGLAGYFIDPNNRWLSYFLFLTATGIIYFCHRIYKDLNTNTAGKTNQSNHPANHRSHLKSEEMPSVPADELPTQKQLNYIQNLRYEGEQPYTKQEASALISSITDLKLTNKEAEKMMLKIRRDTLIQFKKTQQDKLKQVKQMIDQDLKENREIQVVITAGYILEPWLDKNELSPTALIYSKCFVPIQVAKLHPELLIIDGLEENPVGGDDDLPGDTKTVVKPGEFISHKDFMKKFGK